MEIFIGIFALILLGIIIGITFNIVWLAFGRLILIKLLWILLNSEKQKTLKMRLLRVKS